MRMKNDTFWRWVLVALILNIAFLAYRSAYAGTAFYTHETVSGLYKICYYDYLGSTVSYTVRSYKLCPLTIEVDDD